MSARQVSVAKPSPEMYLAAFVWLNASLHSRISGVGFPLRPPAVARQKPNTCVGAERACVVFWRGTGVGLARWSLRTGCERVKDAMRCT